MNSSLTETNRTGNGSKCITLENGRWQSMLHYYRFVSCGNRLITWYIDDQHFANFQYNFHRFDDVNYAADAIESERNVRRC